MEVPELRLIALLRWQLFCTLTFKKADVRDRVRESMLMSFVRKVENVTRVTPRHLLWCSRKERGEIGGRLHFHLLIGGIPAKRVHVGTCFQLMRLWDSVGGGFSQVRVFDPSLDGVGYFMKGLSGADAYESGKFSGRSEVTVSESVRRVVRSGSLRSHTASDTGDTKASETASRPANAMALPKHD